MEGKSLLFSGARDLSSTLDHRRRGQGGPNLLPQGRADSVCGMRPQSSKDALLLQPLVLLSVSVRGPVDAPVAPQLIKHILLKHILDAN
eukprot:95317-Hanusia_phi.AAC.4